MKLCEFKVFDRFDRSRPVAVVMASSPIHALDLYATNNDFPPYSQLVTDEPDANWVYEHDGKLWGIWMNSEVFVELPSAEDVAGAMLFESAVRRGKREILDDVARGVIPAHVTSFGQLHDFVDANEYARDVRFGDHGVRRRGPSVRSGRPGGPAPVDRRRRHGSGRRRSASPTTSGSPRPSRRPWTRSG